jgi:hypothetical protein
MYGCPNNICCEYGQGVDVPDGKNLLNIGVHEARLTVSIKEPGPHSLQIFKLNGERIASKSGQGAGSYSFPHLQMGLYFIKLNVGNREYTRRELVYF